MNLSSFAFESEVSESAMLKVSTDSMRDLGTDVKMPSLRLTSAGTGVTGPAGKWSRRAGRGRAAVYRRVQAPKSFWTGSSSSGPARPRLELHVVIHLSIPSEDNPVGKCRHMYLLQMGMRPSVQRWWAEMSPLNERARGYELRKPFVCQRLK